MHLLPQIIFQLLVITAVVLFTAKVHKIRRNILLGKPDEITGDKVQRWKNVLLLALGQQKMFKKPLPAILHLIVYIGFVIINIEVLEIILDGILGTHRIFLSVLGNYYSWLINSFEVLAVLVIVACVVFLIRRNLLSIHRFKSNDIDGWPRKDANIILITEILLMSAFLKMNAADLVLQSRGVEHYKITETFLVSGALSNILNHYSTGWLMFTERACWWFHIIGILAFLNYLPYSKHLHIVLAFPNAYYKKLTSVGSIANMPLVQHEVKIMMQPELAANAPAAEPQRFGAKDIFDLSWKNVLDAFSCTECGRCTAACPANQTGKTLSPRKIMMDTRDRAEAIGKNIDANGSYKDDGKSLFTSITVEEIRACTTCNACVEACPVSISPLDIIIEMRRYLIMEESNAPQEWNSMFSNVENNFAPWKFPPDERDAWNKEL